MFKKTEETEWTRFSKAFSPGKDEAEETAEAETNSQPAVPPSPAPLTRHPSPETSVSARSASRAPAPSSGEDEVESTIGEHTTVDGTFKSENSIRIRGTVQGEIESRRSILVDAQANVNAKVTAETVTVAGQVNGQIFCTGRVELQPSGRVVGEINAGTLIMQEGAFFEGNLKMGGRTSEIGLPEVEKVPAKK
jgi:cytoskeletal protein CcmA (bactofilin family)